MELKGKVIEIKDNFGYIISNNEYYLFTKYDLLESISLNDDVIFKPIKDTILKATLISKL